MLSVRQCEAGREVDHRRPVPDAAVLVDAANVLMGEFAAIYVFLKRRNVLREYGFWRPCRK
jgi:hypothetical protein